MELDCKEVSRLLSTGADLDLPAPERARLRLHLVVCTSCRNVQQQFDFLRRAMKTLGKNKPPRP